MPARSNNLFNLRSSGIRWQGEVTRPGDAFERYDTVLNGVRAGCRDLLTAQTLHHRMTLAAIATAYAPKSENDTAKYIRDLEHLTGYAPDQRLDLHEISVLERVAGAFAFLESGVRLSHELLRTACLAALGL